MAGWSHIAMRHAYSSQLRVPWGLRACRARQGIARAHRVGAGGPAACQVCRGLRVGERRAVGQGALPWPADAAAQHSRMPARPQDLQAGASSFSTMCASLQPCSSLKAAIPRLMACLRPGGPATPWRTAWTAHTPLPHHPYFQGAGLL